VVEKGLFGSFKAVKVGAGLELWVSFRRCSIFSDLRLEHWFLRRLHRRGYRRGVFHQVIWVGLLHPLQKWFEGKLFLTSSLLGCWGSELELHGLDLLPEAWCRVVEDGRLGMNCYDLEEQPHGSTVKNPICLLSSDEARKKQQLRPYRSWKKLLERLRAILDPVSAFELNCAGLAQTRQSGWD